MINTGTPKQQAWAQSIKAAVLQSYEQRIAEMQNTEFFDDEAAKLGAAHIAKYELGMKFCAEQCDAQFWINNRNASLISLNSKAAK